MDVAFQKLLLRVKSAARTTPWQWAVVTQEAVVEEMASPIEDDLLLQRVDVRHHAQWALLIGRDQLAQECQLSRCVACSV